MPFDALTEETLHGIHHEVWTELEKAMEKFPRFNSPHEGFAIIKEEVDELWDDIKKGTINHSRQEAIQVAAMAIRYVHDIGRSRV